MVELDPNVQLLCHMRLQMGQGESLRRSLQSFCQRHRGELSRQIGQVLVNLNRDDEMCAFLHTLEGGRRIVLDLVVRGLKGEAIFQHLIAIEEEVESQSMRQLDLFLKKLPLKVLLVVMLLQFPALMILAFIPIFSQIKEVLQ